MHMGRLTGDFTSPTGENMSVGAMTDWQPVKMYPAFSQSWDQLQPPAGGLGELSE